MPETLFSPAIHSPAEDGPLGVEGARPGLVADKHDVDIEEDDNHQIVSVGEIPEAQSCGSKYFSISNAERV